MIDYEEHVRRIVTSRLRECFSDIYITGSSSVNAPPRFPCVSFRLESSVVQPLYSELCKIERVTEETYYFEVISNLERGKEQQCKDIIRVIDEAMENEGFLRTFYQAVPSVDPVISRSVARYRKLQTEE